MKLEKCTRWIGLRIDGVRQVFGLTGTALAAVLVTQPSDRLWWTLAPAMFLAGVGGGGVISPNFTLTLAEVPPQMGGAAGGALQTGQRIGSALGAALLMTVYQAVSQVTSAPVAARSWASSSRARRCWSPRARSTPSSWTRPAR